MCYKTGLQGPCPDGMSLGALLTSPTYGRCSCNCFSALAAFQVKSREDLLVNPISPFMDQQRRFCSDKYSKSYANHVDGKCYKLYTRGPCIENETFVIGPGRNGAKCKVTKCSFAGFPKALPVKKNGECGEDDNECYITERENQVPVCMPCSFCPYVPKPSVEDVEDTKICDSEDCSPEYYDADTSSNGDFIPSSIDRGIKIRKEVCGGEFYYNVLLKRCVSSRVNYN